MTFQILEGDCLEVMREMYAESVQTCVTSPPYWGLRDYGTATWDGGEEGCDHAQGRPGAGRADGVVDERAQRNRDGAGAMGGDCQRCGATRIDSQLGLEPTPEEYVANLVAVFREVRRVLRDDGTLWLNLGDSYASSGATDRSGNARLHEWNGDGAAARGGSARRRLDGNRDVGKGRAPTPTSCKPKDLVGIPWMVAFALRADGWYLRSDIIWAKPNPMPESVTDRPTKAHEYLFLLTKSPRYFYDADAIREEPTASGGGANFYAERGLEWSRTKREDDKRNGGTGRGLDAALTNPAGRNKRSVWTVATQPFPGAHFATFPPKLIEPCILAGSPPKCCGECGAPWERVVERTPMVVTPTPKREAWQASDDHARTQVGGTMTEAPTSTTVGWRATCDCPSSAAGDHECEPSIVLDPFAGAGTAGVVALRHNRSFVGIELNPEYAQMARHRITDDAPLFNVEAAS